MEATAGSGESQSDKKYKWENKIGVDNGFTIELHLFVPKDSQNYNEVIAQRLNTDKEGFTLALKDSSGLFSPSEETDLQFTVSDSKKSNSITTRIKPVNHQHSSSLNNKPVPTHLK